MKKSHILICAPFVTLPDEPGDNRFIALAKRLSKNYSVTLVTSRFHHRTKRRRERISDFEWMHVEMLDEPGYQKNVGVGRFLSHWIFCRNLKRYLSKAPRFDLVYSAFPLVQTNLLLGAWCKELSLPLVIDVQDVWPEAIAGSIPALSGRLGMMLMYGLTVRSNRAFAMADALVAVSNTYLERANVKCLPENRKVVAYIGCKELWFRDEGPIPLRDIERPLKAVYLGSLSGSYDIETLVRAAALAPEIEIEIIGDGPHGNKLRSLNAKLGGRAQFIGMLPHQEAIARTVSADVALNAIKSSALQSVTNKLSDYFCAGLPILSCQMNDEVKHLLGEGGGVTYEAGNEAMLSKLLIQLANEPEALRQMSYCNRAIAHNLFMRSKSYEKIIDLIDRIISNN